MAVERLKNQAVRTQQAAKKTLKGKFKQKMAAANTVAELKVLVRILSKHVFGEPDDEQ